jgi:hypothetical protein
MKKLITLLLCLVFFAINAQETINREIVSGNDDAWQTYYLYFGSTDSVGDIFVDGEYLSMGFDAWPEDPPYLTHHLGLRYINIPILPASTIHSAYIQFTSYSANKKPDKIFIRGEKNPSPPEFLDVPFNISDRIQTDTFVRWEVPEWQMMIPGPAQKTPNLKYIVQELIDQPGWTANKPMAFILSGIYTLLTDTTLPRQACSWEYMGEMYAPILTITYSDPAGIYENDQSSFLKIFPNPVKNEFSLAFTALQSGEYFLRIFNLEGQEMYSASLPHQRQDDLQIDLSASRMNLKPGVYMLSLSGPQTMAARKIIVQY